MNKTFVGVDYSINSPAICIINQIECSDGKNIRWVNPLFVGFDNRKSSPELLREGNESCGIHVYRHTDYENAYHKYSSMANKFISMIQYHAAVNESDEVIVSIEDYIKNIKFGSNNITDMAEAAAFFKSKAYDFGYYAKPVNIVQVKKFATGNGNAKKDAMLTHFQKSSGIEFPEISGRDITKHPLEDFVDAWYICRYTIHNTNFANNSQ